MLGFTLAAVFAGWLKLKRNGYLLFYISFVMLKGKIFSKLNTLPGIIGSCLIMFYIISVTFLPVVEKMATDLGMLLPGVAIYSFFKIKPVNQK